MHHKQNKMMMVLKGRSSICCGYIKGYEEKIIEDADE